MRSKCMTATMRIETFWKDGERKAGTVCYPNGGGYESLKKMQKELLQRFQHRSPEIVPNGVKLDGDYGTYQIVSWTES
jgi:hypothetical protein